MRLDEMFYACNQWHSTYGDYSQAKLSAVGWIGQ